MWSRRRGGVRAGAAHAAARTYNLPFGGGVGTGDHLAGDKVVGIDEEVIEEKSGAEPTGRLDMSITASAVESWTVDRLATQTENGKYEGNEFGGVARRLSASAEGGGQLQGSVRTCTHEYVTRAVSARGPACDLPAGPLADSFRSGPT